MKRLDCFIASLLMLVAAMTASASTWTLNGRAYQLDTLIYPHPVGPGVILTKYDLPELPLKVSVMEVDLKNPYMRMETCLGGETAVGCETPASMIARNTAPGHEVVGACNGDFYLTSPPAMVGMPRSGQLRRGEVVVNPVGVAAFVLDDQNRPYIDRVDFSAQAVHGATSFRVHTVNMLNLEYESTGGNQTILFTNSYGPKTYLMTSGKLVLIAPREGNFAWAPNASETGVVESVVDASGQVEIPAGKAFMWMQGSDEAYATAMQPGDEVTVSLNVSLRSQSTAGINLKEMMGGSNTIIMRNGVREDLWEERHPRTCIGFTADSTRMFVVVVDGRAITSVGITMNEAYDIFNELGCANAVNLDGGGSTCMIANDDVINTPSDGSMRAVGNGCLFISNAPIDDEIGILNFAPRSYYVTTAAMFTPSVWGYNQYGVLKSRDVKDAVITCDPAIGTMGEDGTFTASVTPGVGYLYATLGGVTTRQLITVNATDMSLQGSSVVVDKNHPYSIAVAGVSGESTDLVNPAVFDWTVEDTGVCTVDASGTIYAVADGTTRVFGSGYGFADTLEVNVQNPRARVACIEDAPIDPSTWTVAQSGGKNRTVTALDNGLKIDFTGSSSRSAYVRLTKKMTLWGIPDTLRVRFRPNGLEITHMTVSMTANNAGNQVISDVAQVDTIAGECMMTLPTASWCDAQDLACYPLGFVYLNFYMASPTSGQEYSLEIPGIELIYQYDEAVPCDLNGDGIVDITDVNIVINAVLGKTVNGKADVNADGILDITDVNTIINKVLGK